MTCSVPRVRLVRKWHHVMTQAAIMELEDHLKAYNDTKHNVMVTIVTLHMRGVSEKSLKPYFAELKNHDEYIERTNRQLAALRSELEHSYDV
jgi:hypothetical protein